MVGVTSAIYLDTMAHDGERKASLEKSGPIVVINHEVPLAASVVATAPLETPKVISIAEAAESEEIVLDETNPALLRTPQIIEQKQYIRIIDSCGPHFDGECVNARSGPSTTSPAVLKLRNDVVLATNDLIERDGSLWYQVYFDEWIRYPSRIKKKLYVAATYAEPITADGPALLDPNAPTTTKYIVVERSKQHLTAYNEDGSIFMDQDISTGLDATPTPRGIFTIFQKTPSRYMQGPLPGISNDYYDLPGVPWNMYFTEQGGALHGAYWHDKFGRKWSHGCVNLPPEKAHELYTWAELGTKVVIRD